MPAGDNLPAGYTAPSTPNTDLDYEDAGYTTSGRTVRRERVTLARDATGQLALIATQATLAAVLAKLIAAPATEAKQDTANTSLASILAKIIVAPSTEAKQDTANASLASLDGKLADESGAWGYAAGTSGTVIVPANKRVVGIAAHATSAGSFTINAGATIVVPANSSIEITPKANLVAPTIVFSANITSHFIEFIE